VLKENYLTELLFRRNLDELNVATKRAGNFEKALIYELENESEHVCCYEWNK
jgi:hypothetical protein